MLPRNEPAIFTADKVFLHVLLNVHAVIYVPHCIFELSAQSSNTTLGVYTAHRRKHAVDHVQIISKYAFVVFNCYLFCAVYVGKSSLELMLF
jgi:hypothetical protein